MVTTNYRNGPVAVCSLQSVAVISHTVTYVAMAVVYFLLADEFCSLILQDYL